jgi:cysteine desulfurase
MKDLDAGAWDHVAEIRDSLEERLVTQASDAILIGKDSDRLPNTTCIAVPAWKGETQVMQMDLAGFAISAGSACSSGKVKSSRVLQAMGFDDMTAASAIRVSLGPTTTRAEAEAFAEAWLRQYEKFRARVA